MTDVILPRRGVLGLAAATVAMPTGLLHAEPVAASSSFLALLGVLAGIVLPTGQTVSAGASADLAFILRAIEAGLAGATQNTLSTLAITLDSDARSPFLTLRPTDQAAVLQRLDSAVFGTQRRKDTGWEATKALILMSYYSSEAGASQELAYEPVPGRFDPDLAVTPATRAISNDWTGAGLRLTQRS